VAIKYGAQLLTLKVDHHSTCHVPNHAHLCRRSVA